jgi:hypothetical protein
VTFLTVSITLSLKFSNHHHRYDLELFVSVSSINLKENPNLAPFFFFINHEVPHPLIFFRCKSGKCIIVVMEQADEEGSEQIEDVSSPNFSFSKTTFLCKSFGTKRISKKVLLGKKQDAVYSSNV